MNKAEKWGVLLLLVLCAVAAAVLLRPKQPGTVARISQNGALLMEIDLSELTEPVTCTVEGENGLFNVIYAERDRIRMESATCPDQICVHQGWIYDSAMPIVCMPNKLVVEIVGEGVRTDAVTK